MFPAERKEGSPRFGKLHFPVGLWINSPKKRLAKMSRRWPSAGSVRSNSSDTASRGSEPLELRPAGKAKASRHKRLSNLFHRSGAAGAGARWLSEKKLEELVDPDAEALGRAGGGADPPSSPRQLPGILKIFGGTLSRGANYKSVLATARSTARELLWEALERYGLAPEAGILGEYVLCDVVGRPGAGGGGWLTEHLRPIGDAERPLVLQEVWKPKSGCSRRFEIRRRQEVERFFEADAGEGSGGSAQARRLQRNRSRAASGGPPPPKERSETPSLRRSISDMNLSTRRRRERKAVLSVAGGDPTAAPPTTTADDDGAPPAPSADGAAAGGGEEEEGGDGSLEQLSQCLIQPPQHHPYFLLLQGYGKQDFVLYVMTRPEHIFGRRGPPERPPQGSPPIDTFLNAPDILPRHCLVRAPGGPATVRPYRGAPVTHNGVPLFRRAPLNPGDLLGLGQHFLLLYKDPRGGGPEEQSPPWLPALRCEGCSTGRSRREALRSPRAELRYRPEHEERLLREIVREPRDAGGAPQGMGVLAPAFLLGLCMEHAWSAFPPQHLPQLLTRIAGLVKEEVWEKIKEIGDRQPENDGDPSAQGVLGPDLRPLTLWLANATELLNLAQARVLALEKELELEGPCPELSGDLETCDEAMEAMGVLDEVIMSTFQQTVYYLTKRLYATLPALLEANPFAAPLEAGAEPLRVPEGVSPTLSVFRSALELSRGCRLHPALVSQTFGYLFFFCNASLFNSLMERGGALFQWGRAVRLRTTLDLVLDSVAAMGLGDVASEFFQKLSAASNLLCTPRACLSKMTWSRLRAEFPALSPAQLHHILSHYQLGGGQAPPPAWSPPPEERDQVTAGDIFESFSEHPPLLLPSRGFLLRPGGGAEDSGGAPEDKGAIPEDKGGVPDEEGGLLQALCRMRRLLWDLEQDEVPANQRGLPREGAA
ncbi:LOW QUALITY PROTEIN: ras-interacting protein 1 [Guaruba guarouba]